MQTCHIENFLLHSQHYLFAAPNELQSGMTDILQRRDS